MEEMKSLNGKASMAQLPAPPVATNGQVTSRHMKFNSNTNKVQDLNHNNQLQMLTNTNRSSR